ncbi:hypothetical protein PHYSODRAFT_309722 [Phytophthora sojae]|uniref:RxLR effector protein n=1 Tax=Phytophthora sojae (strain P6497) TaxID=1094619 RepID=G4YMU8_PHYSP|nr:hypothetical protein PHYSODRAFT_309722 [Phytophthora sojae]EGZ29293.1 hypothetical protein PHYSODRAFT_309722 [Phytophthora sojae]|eukprot:XP_009516568.1 hypothetical protein PHYSODRAFT_309722 [Phytophthora sojae]
MRFLLLVVVALALFAYSGAVSTSSRRLQASANPHSLSYAENSPSFGKRILLRSGSDNARATTSIVDGEERMGVKDVLKVLYNAIKMKIKMKYWLFRGKTPEQVLEKLKVASKTDKNYKYYAKYFYKYYVKYPARQPSTLPTETAENIIKSRLRQYLDDNLSPPQVFAELGLTGSFASARGQPNYEYFEQYYNMWSDLQVRLSQAN